MKADLINSCGPLLMRSKPQGPSACSCVRPNKPRDDGSSSCSFFVLGADQASDWLARKSFGEVAAQQTVYDANTFCQSSVDHEVQYGRFDRQGRNFAAS